MLEVGPAQNVRENLNSYWLNKAFKTFYNVPFHPGKFAPSNWKELQALYRYRDSKGWALSVSEHVAETTIYAHPDDNFKARAWHAMVHAENGLDFSYENELIAADIQLDQLRIIKAPECVYKAHQADTYGQTLYHAVNGAFPRDQLAFASACRRYGITETIGNCKFY